MTKGLEALENIKREAGIPFFSSLYDIDEWKKDFKTIEKELKALEIIIKKDVETGVIPYYVKQVKGGMKYYKNPVEAYNFFEIQNEDYKLTEEEFNLLKEVLE